MSWSLTAVGKVKGLVKYMTEYAEKLKGASREEYEAALPHMIGVVRQNVCTRPTEFVKVEASGHGMKDAKTGEWIEMTTQVKVTKEYVNILPEPEPEKDPNLPETTKQPNTPKTVD